MKNLRNVLTLILVLILVFGVMPAANADYTDQESIQNSAAVAVLTTLSAIEGYEDGTFRPTETVTRGEMAKMVAAVVNNGVDVGSLYASACPFPDTVGHWSAGYVAYCHTMGLVSGKSAEVFSPDSKVTGVEAAKMLLCTLGYNATSEGFVGANWNHKVLSVAADIDLFFNLGNVKMTTNLTRDNAAQVIVNTLRCTMVSYPTTNPSFSTGGITVTSGAKAQPVTNTSNNDRCGATPDGILQLCEKYYPQLGYVKYGVGTTDGHDELGRPADVWTFGPDSEILGCTPIKRLDAKDNAAYTGDAIYELVNNRRPANIVVYMNGYRYESTLAEVEVVEAQIAALKSSPSFTASGLNALTKQLNTAQTALFMIPGNTQLRMAGYNTTAAGRGTTCELYYDSVSDTLTILYVYPYAGEIIACVEPERNEAGNVIQDGYITVSPLYNRLANNAGNSVITYSPIQLPDGSLSSGGADSTTEFCFITNDFTAADAAKRTKVSYVFADKDHHVWAATGDDANGRYVVQSVEPLSEITVTIESVSKTAAGTITSFKADGSTYRPAFFSFQRNSGIWDRSTTSSPMLPDSETAKGLKYTLSLSSAGNVVTAESASSSIAYVLDTTTQNDRLGSFLNYAAKLLYPSGTISWVTTDQGYAAYRHQAVAYSVNTLGNYVLTSDSTVTNLPTVSATVNTNSAVIELNNGSSVAADSTTVFVVESANNDGTYSYYRYEGIYNVPAITNCSDVSYVRNNSTGHVETMFLFKAIMGASNDSTLGVVLKKGDESMTVTPSASYYSLVTLLGDTKYTMYVDPILYGNLPNGITVYNSYSMNANSVVTNLRLTGCTRQTINMVEPAANEVITLNGTGIAYDSNVVVYIYNETYDTLRVANVEAVRTISPTANSYYTYETRHGIHTLTGIFITTN